MVNNVDTDCTCRWTLVKGKRQLHKEGCPMHDLDHAPIIEEAAEEESRPPARRRLVDQAS